MRIFISVVICFFLLFFGCKKEDDIFQSFIDTTVVDSIKIARKVLVIGIDGFRSDAMQETITPFLHNFSLDASVYYNPSHFVERDTYSGPNWSSILTGVHYNKHNVVDNSFQGNNYNEYPPFFYYVEKINVDINTVSIVNWSPINEHMLSSYTDYSPFESISDSLVFHCAEKLLTDGDPISPDILFLHFDELDAAGHNYGFSPFIEEYRNTLKILDVYVHTLFNIIQNKRLLGEDWMFIVISDHGGDGTGHGDPENPYINKTIFFSQHPSIVFDHNYITNQSDLAPTILDFIGISDSGFDRKTDGRSILQKN